MHGLLDLDVVFVLYDCMYVCMYVIYIDKLQSQSSVVVGNTRGSYG